MTRLLAALVTAALLALGGEAAAQSPVRICIQSIGSQGQNNCVDISATFPLPVVPGASASSTIGITPVVSASAESSHVLKAAAGNLYGVYVSNPSATGFLMVFNSATVPGDGAVTPIECVPVTASNIGYVNYLSGPPEVFSAGIAVAYSSTGCFTKTTSPTAFFHGFVQ